MALVDFSLDDIGGVFTDLRTAITGKEIESEKDRAEMLYKLKLLENQILEGQMAINKVEASSKNWFVSSWRPLIGYICGAALAYHFILAPFLHSIFFVYEVEFPLPELEVGMLMNLLTAMLGIAGLRTWEKTKGVHNNTAE